MYGFLLLLGKEGEQGAPAELPKRSGQQQIKKTGKRVGGKARGWMVFLCHTLWVWVFLIYICIYSPTGTARPVNMISLVRLRHLHI